MRVLVLVAGPVVLLAALVVRFLSVELAGFTAAERARFDTEQFAAPEQLAAYVRVPELVVAGHALHLVASVLLAATVVVFAREIGGWLAFAGALLYAGSLFTRFLGAGIDLTAFQLVDRLGLERATAFMMESYVDLAYGYWRIPVTMSAAALVGVVLMAVAGWRSKKLNVVQCALLLSFGWLFMGILKEATLVSVLHGGVAAVILFGWTALRPAAAARARPSRSPA